MVTIAAWLFGPLVGPECQRALARGWLILVRTLAAMAVMAPTIVVLWLWWMARYTNPTYSPYELFRTGIIIVEGFLISASLILAPAVLAGSLAGEKERGALGLLLTTRVSPYEIVMGRVAGKLAQISMILLGGLPPLVLFAGWSGVYARELGALLGMIAAVTLGAAGIATAVSAVSRRGRDALLSVYLIEALCLLAPAIVSLGNLPKGGEIVSALNPYHGLAELIWQEDYQPALITMAAWFGMGIVGLAVASWRLYPASLKELDGSRKPRRSYRRSRVPEPYDEHPMIWKELYVERGGALGGVGRWLIMGLTVLLMGGTIGLASMIAWEYIFRYGDMSTFEWVRDIIQRSIEFSGYVVGWLVAWAIGLRAAVVIASERERGTWDAILTSPLESRDIINAKLWGSLYALRWLIVAALLNWTVAWALGVIGALQYFDWVLGMLVGGTFMAVAGLRSSLASATATKAMAVTMGIWLLAQVAGRMIAGLLVGLSLVIVVLSASLLSDAPVFQIMGGYSWMLGVGWVFSVHLVFGIATVILLGYTRILFDRLAGRRAGGRLSVTAERLLNGDPTLRIPVKVGPKEKYTGVDEAVDAR